MPPNQIYASLFEPDAAWEDIVGGEIPIFPVLRLPRELAPTTTTTTIGATKAYVDDRLNLFLMSAKAHQEGLLTMFNNFKIYMQFARQIIGEVEYLTRDPIDFQGKQIINMARDYNTRWVIKDDTTTPIQNAHDSIPGDYQFGNTPSATNPWAVMIPPGEWINEELSLDQGYVHLIGRGMYATIINTDSPTNAIISITTGANNGIILIQDMTLEIAATYKFVVEAEATGLTLIFKNVRFYNSGVNRCYAYKGPDSGANSVYFVDCVFEGNIASGVDNMQVLPEEGSNNDACSDTIYLKSCFLKYALVSGAITGTMTVYASECEKESARASGPDADFVVNANCAVYIDGGRWGAPDKSTMLLNMTGGTAWVHGTQVFSDEDATQAILVRGGTLHASAVHILGGDSAIACSGGTVNLYSGTYHKHASGANNDLTQSSTGTINTTPMVDFSSKSGTITPVAWGEFPITPTAAPDADYEVSNKKYVDDAVGGAGHVVGPASATDHAIVRYDLTTGKLIQDSGVIIDDSNNVSGIVGLTLTPGSQAYTFGSITGLANSISLQSQTAGTYSILGLFAKDGDATDVVSLRLYGMGTSASAVVNERLEAYWSTANSRYEIATFYSGGGSAIRALALYTQDNANQLVLNTDGSINMSGNLVLDDGASLSLQEDITFTGATTENQLKIPDNLLVALDVNENGNSYMQISTVNDEEDIIFYKSVDILHTATHADDHALEVDANAAGYGDIKAIDIDYITGDITDGEDEGIVLVNVDKTLAEGGDIFALEVLATDQVTGSTGTYGMKVGAEVGPIHQDSGTFANPTTGTDNTTSTDVAAMIDGSSGTTTAIFENNSEYILIGAATAFQEIEFIITTGASGAGIKPTFWYSTAGSHQFTQFTPVDGTDGFKHTGVVAWDASDLSSHAVNTDTGTYDIKVIRTRSNLTTSPVLGYAKTAATTEYVWDKDGNVNIKSLALSGGATVTEIKDEDDMASDSATMLATQQSTKAYVDASGEGHITILPYLANTVVDGTWVLAVDVSQILNGFFYNFTSADGNNVTYKVYLAKGTYRFDMIGITAADGGILDIDIDGVEVASNFDLYSAGTLYNVGNTQGSIVVATSGPKTIRLRVDGKHASSSAYRVFVTYFVFSRTA